MPRPLQKKLELECRLEEERMRVEGEKSQLEVATVTLQTRLKQVAEHSESHTPSHPHSLWTSVC